MGMNKKRSSIIICVCLCIILAIFTFYKNTPTISTPPTLDSKYDITKEMKIAKDRYDLSSKASILTSGKVNQESISLVFEDLANKETMLEVLTLLDNYHVKSTFFVTGNQCVEQEELIKEITNRGHTVASLTLDGKVKKEELTVEECRKDFVLSSKIIESTIKTKPIYLRCNDTKYTDGILANAKAAGYQSIVVPTKFISYQSFKKLQQAQDYVNNLSSGSIVSIKTKGVLNASEYENKKTIAIDKKEGINEATPIQNVDIIQIIEWLLQSLQNKKQIVSLEILSMLQANYQEIPTTVTFSKPVQKKQHKDFSSLIISNNKKQIVPIDMFYTTQKAVAYSFRGIDNVTLLYQILDTLDQMNAKATFFVTIKDIEQHRDSVLEIIKRGHEIGNGGITGNMKLLEYSTQQLCQEIYECHQAITSLGVNTSVYMPANGNTNATVNEALSVIKQVDGMQNYELIANPRSVPLSKYTGMKAKDIVADYFKDISYLSLRMGDIVYFKLDNTIITDDEKVNLLTEINEQVIKNGRVRKLINGQYVTQLAPLNYKITSIATIQNTYETKTSNGRYNLVNGTGEVYANKVDSTTAYNSIIKQYIGNHDQNDWHFDNKELYQQLDNTGTIDTFGKPVIFFTFDDWSGDPITQELLDVLDKHNVNASFFIIARNVDLKGGLSNTNPNLLRAMALKGHDIGSHMYDHETLGANKEIVKNSVIKSYQVMHQSIGDLASLKPYFRPPQLLITSYGLQQVMESGYQYSISGTNSTGDYKASSATEILSVLEAEIAKEQSKTQGTTFVMHVNDQSTYTAQAVDMFLTKNEQGAYGIKYQIAKLSDYLK